MAVFSKFYRLPLLLAVLCCLVAFILAVQWYYVSRNEQQILQRIEKPVTSNVVLADPPQDNLLLEGEVKFEEIMSRPLFIKSRQPIPEDLTNNDVVDAPVSQPITDLSAKFTGYIEVPGGKIALIKDIKTRKYHRLHKGEQVNDWTLAELHPDRVVFKQGDAHEELLLREPKAKKPARTGRAQRVMRPSTTPMGHQPKSRKVNRRQQQMKRIDRGKPNASDPANVTGW